jgi:hypothetical protein
MQTFLPYSSFVESARALDNRRLGKQRVETMQILNALSRADYGWQHHPAVKMWRGHEHQLIIYGLAICLEWQKRGFKDTCFDKIELFLALYPHNTAKLDWVTDDLCRSHQSNLKRKDPVHYGPIWPEVPDNLPYVWPIV